MTPATPAPSPAKSSTRRRTLIVVAVVVVAVIALLSIGMCTGGRVDEVDETAGEATPTAAQDGDEAMYEEPLYAPVYKPTGAETAVITVSRGAQTLGTVRLKFYADTAPNHVASFVELAEKGYYDGIAFHRVIPGFVAQAGDPGSKGVPTDVLKRVAERAEQQMPADEGDPQIGGGSPGYRLKTEISERKHLKGTLSMARMDDPYVDSAGSQFYICLAPQPSLDGKYTVFGEVTEGMDVVEKVQVGDVMTKVVIENAK